MQEQDWSQVLNAKDVDEKAETLHNLVMNQLDEFCPVMTRKVSSDDQPFFTHQLKRLDRKRRREFRKHRRSAKYKRLHNLYKKKVSEAKKKFKQNMIDDVMTARSGQWYSKLKRISNFDQIKSENIQVDEISHLSNKEQAEAIADSFAKISNEYEAIKKKDIKIPPFSTSDIPQYTPLQVKKYLQ